MPKNRKKRMGTLMPGITTVTMIEQERGAREFELRHSLNRFQHHLRAAYRDVRRVEMVEMLEAGVLQIHIQLMWGVQLQHSIGAGELRMGGPLELARWFRTVEHDVEHHIDRYRRSLLVPPPDDRIQGAGITSAFLDEAQDTTEQYARHLLTYGSATFRYDPSAILRWDHFSQDADTPEAIERAQDLFKLGAGQAAFDTLKANKPLPITGSQGTKYLLLKKATFCIQRVSDNALLCAVVPGVPLWDHLLGIKLMVEHDEPAFLKIANVAGGSPQLDGSFRSEWARLQNTYIDQILGGMQT